RILRLEDVPADRDACGAACDRTLDHAEGCPIRVELGPAGDEDRDRATANDLPERVARTGVDRLDDIGTEFRADSGHVLYDVDIVGILDVRSAGIHHRQEWTTNARRSSK